MQFLLEAAFLHLPLRGQWVKTFIRVPTRCFQQMGSALHKVTVGTLAYFIDGGKKWFLQTPEEIPPRKVSLITF